MARWSRRLEADSADPSALLALATFARLTFRYDRAARFYERLRQRHGGDEWGTYATLGLAEADRVHGSLADSALAALVEAERIAPRGDPALHAELRCTPRSDPHGRGQVGG